MSKVKKVVTQRNAGPVDMAGSTKFPLAKGLTLEYVKGVHRLVFGKDSFFVILYGALNAGGLIGTEHNGISICWENKGKVIFTDHCCKSPFSGAIWDRQWFEYRRICDMDAAQFKEFVNTHPKVMHQVMVPKPKPIVRPKLDYRITSFRETQFNTAADKLSFLHALIKFLCYHCDRDLFTRQIYEGLHLHLGHNAHYDLSTYYNEWFYDLVSRIRFLERHSRNLMYGDWRDVGGVFQLWIAGPEGQAVLAYYANERANKVEAAERRQLETLKAKYEVSSGKNGG